jgi:hypothetical protein
MYVVNDGYTLWDFATTPPRFPHHTLRYDRYTDLLYHGVLHSTGHPLHHAPPWLRPPPLLLTAVVWVCVEETCRFIGNVSRSDGAQPNGYKGRLRQSIGEIKKYLDANCVAFNIIYMIKHYGVVLSKYLTLHSRIKLDCCWYFRCVVCD